MAPWPSRYAPDGPFEISVPPLRCRDERRQVEEPTAALALVVSAVLMVGTGEFAPEEESGHSKAIGGSDGKNSGSWYHSRQFGTVLRDSVKSLVEVRSNVGAMDMLRWALIFLLISLVAGGLGFTGLSAGAARISKILFIIFGVLFFLVVLVAYLIGEAFFWGRLLKQGGEKAESINTGARGARRRRCTFGVYASPRSHHRFIGLLIDVDLHSPFGDSGQRFRSSRVLR
jgi:uncharacterized membrane protein YtjA (UPF0391 family)